MGETVQGKVEWRKRVNVSISVKGIKTYDCTVEGINVTSQELLDASDSLVKQLDQRYPPIPS